MLHLSVHVKLKTLCLADEVVEVQTCAICHGTLKHGFQRRLMRPKRLPCGHVFHLGCLRRWMIHSLGSDASCPMCRAPLHNALEANHTDCWETKVAAGIRWWLDWPKQHAASVRPWQHRLLCTSTPTSGYAAFAWMPQASLPRYPCFLNVSLVPEVDVTVTSITGKSVHVYGCASHAWLHMQRADSCSCMSESAQLVLRRCGVEDSALAMAAGEWYGGMPYMPAPPGQTKASTSDDRGMCAGYAGDVDVAQLGVPTSTRSCAGVR